jgi:hypothetical protein
VSTIATYIRDAIFERLTTSAFDWKSTRKTPFPTMQIGDAPALGVFLLRETYNPDGDGNVGPPRYIVDAVFAIAVVDLASKPAVLEGSVDQAVDTILDTLLKDHTFIDLRWSDNSPLLDSIPTITRAYNFPNIGDTYYLECRLQMTVRYFCYFDPVAPNALTTVAVHAKKLDNTAASGQAVMTIPLEQ